MITELKINNGLKNVEIVLFILKDIQQKKCQKLCKKNVTFSVSEISMSSNS